MRNRKTGFAVAALVAAAALMLGIWYFNLPQTREGAKTVVVEVVHADESTREFTCRTDAEYLGEALQEAALIEGEEGPFGMYITVVDGVAADDSLQQWWCITKDGEQVNTGADTTPVADGDCFEITLMTGY